MTIAERILSWISELSSALENANAKIKAKGGVEATDIFGIGDAVETIPQEGNIDLGQLEKDGVYPAYVPKEYSFIGAEKTVQRGSAEIYRNKKMTITENGSYDLDNGFYFFQTFDVNVPQRETGIDTSSLTAEGSHVLKGTYFVGKNGVVEEGSMTDAVLGNAKLSTSDMASNYLISLPVNKGGYVQTNTNGMTIGSIDKYIGITTITPKSSKQTVSVGGKYCPENIVFEAVAVGEVALFDEVSTSASTKLVLPFDLSIGGEKVLLAEQVGVDSPSNSARLLAKRILIDLNSTEICVLTGVKVGLSKTFAGSIKGTVDESAKTISLSGVTNGLTVEFNGTYKVYQI